MSCDHDSRHDVAINAVPMLSDFLLPALMEVAIAHPTIGFRYRPAIAIQCLHAPSPGAKPPLALSLRAGAEPSQADGISVRRLGLLGVGLYAAESYVMKFGKAQEAADLAGHVLVHRDASDNAPWEHWLTLHAPEVRFILRSDDEAAQRAAVRSGHCAAFMPIAARLFNTQLRTVMAPRDEWAAPLWLVTPACLSMPDPVLAAVAMLGDRLSRSLGGS
ncbi:hypothetical protein DRW48_03185 [Paracoccus suum]|uniref:LysR substrate-binding domain-containing protein n=1 Tax=Paracoccus suum TaxID=2259340 RepID=A0A344PHH1_9RHOB|nr:LysR substrate-binding domain-containing protein [Paracoccus suum]AXC48826.1 hypothetical protein DRW48_03185 [Paracoccus suum]